MHCGRGVTVHQLGLVWSSRHQRRSAVMVFSFSFFLCLSSWQQLNFLFVRNAVLKNIVQSDGCEKICNHSENITAISSIILIPYMNNVYVNSCECETKVVVTVTYSTQHKYYISNTLLLCGKGRRE